LNRVTSQRKKVLLELFIFLVLPVLINVFLIKVVLPRWNERRNDFLVPEILPGEIFEPGMLLDLRWPVFAESVYRLSLYHLHKSLTTLRFIPY
jgi:hypothetical protein